jgi:hypothetical protein
MMSTGRRIAAIMAIGLGLLAAAGCAKGPNRLKVSGTVLYKGQPLDQGRIEFEPDDPGAKFFGGAPIEAGAFIIPSSLGLMPGRYKVRVYSSDRVLPPGDGPPPPPGSPGMPTPKERVAAKFNTQTTLTAEVKPDAENVFTFNVE